MNTAHPESRAFPAALWILIPGAVGFAAGFFGPITFNPEANQGPLLGIFITGPAGAILGAVLLGICRVARVSAAGQKITLFTSCAILAGVTLYFCMPEPQLRGLLVDAKILSCELPSQRTDAAIQDWEKRVANVTWASPRPNWQEDERKKIGNDHGAVLHMELLKKKSIYEHKKPWDNGQITAGGWRPATADEQKSYYIDYLGSSCVNYPVGGQSVHFIPYDISGINRSSADWPPTKPSDFLDLQTLQPVPDEYMEFAKN